MDEKKIRALFANELYERKLKTQKELKAKGLHIGDCVKIPLGESETIEHIWFIVISVDGDVVTGKLDNEPRYPQKIKYGELLIFSITEVEEVLPKEDGK